MHTPSEGEGDDGLLDDLAAIRPTQNDVFARSVQHSVRNALVGGAGDPFRFGRFTVLGPLGGGGMGTVFVAYDPDLDRKIALKVLHVRGEQGRRDMLREGRALARLKHPNVVTVYEVGVVDDRVFVAMEYVAGQNLREWLREPRPVDTILARLLEAGRGLAAAHAVDLVHRDCKPENLVIDADGHTRVIDFGLARPLEDSPLLTTADDTSSPGPHSLRAGTPAYMPPERLAGGQGDARSDQYAYCVTCWEALLGARPPAESPGRRVPAWLRRALERGLASDPAKRWPAMAPLLAALERGRTRARLRSAAVALTSVALLAGGAEGYRRWDLAERAAAHARELAEHATACDDAGAAVDAIWNDAARARITAAFTATGLGYASTTATHVMPWIDRRAAAWKQARTTACRSADPLLAGTWSPDTLDRAVLCLEDHLFSLEHLIDAYSQANKTLVQKAVSFASTADRTADCTDERLLARRPVPAADSREVLREVRAELARAGAISYRGDFPGAQKAITRARERAEQAIDWPPLWATARAQEAAALEKTGAFPEAEAASVEAYFTAARGEAWEIAADAATKLVYTVGYKRARPDEGRAWARHAELAIALVGEPDDRWTPTLLNNLGTLQFSAHQYKEAQASWERVLEIQERRLGPEHPQVAMCLNNLGNVFSETGAYADAKRMYARSLAIKEKALGPDHPDLATSLNNLASVHNNMGERAEAIALFTRALAIFEAAVGPDHPDVAMALGNLATMHNLGGDPATALALNTRALAIREKTLAPDHPDLVNNLSNLGSVHRTMKQYAEARGFYERALAIADKSPGGELQAAKLRNNLALVYQDTGDPAQALALYERALAGFEKAQGANHPAVALNLYNLANLHYNAGRPQLALPMYERAATIFADHPGTQPGEIETHFDIARTLVALRRDRARAIAEATRARDAYRDAGNADKLARTEQWLAEHPA